MADKPSGTDPKAEPKQKPLRAECIPPNNPREVDWSATK